MFFYKAKKLFKIIILQLKFLSGRADREFRIQNPVVRMKKNEILN